MLSHPKAPSGEGASVMLYVGATTGGADHHTCMPGHSLGLAFAALHPSAPQLASGWVRRSPVAAGAVFVVGCVVKERSARWPGASFVTALGLKYGIARICCQWAFPYIFMGVTFILLNQRLAQNEKIFCGGALLA